MWALLPNSKRRQYISSAFTIVELLIVIVVIAILAAITIVAYNGIQDRAKASAAAQGLSNAAKKIKYWQAEQDSVTFPDCVAFSTALGVTPTSCTPTVGGVAYQYTQDLGGTYCITATVNGKSYMMTGNATQSSDGACAGHGKDGVAAVTNLVTNPNLATYSTSWAGVTSTNGAYTAARTTAVSGLSSLGITTSWRITLTAAPDTWWRNQYGSIPVTPGQAYTYSAYIRPSVSVPTGVIIIWRNSSNVTIAESASGFSTQTASTWQRKSVTATAPAGAVSAVLHSGSTSGGTVGAYIDTTAVMFTAGSDLYNYADGNTAGWAWTNTPNNSTSTGIPQ